MKFVGKFLVASAVAIACFSASAWAEQIGVVDMQSIFQSAPQVKKINADLTQQFQSRKDSLTKLSDQLKDDIKKYQKNKAVMSKDDLSALESKITNEETQYRQDRATFEQDVYQAQNQQMSQFLTKVKESVKTLASQKKLDIVLPKNSVLFSQDNLDITSDVLASLKS